MLQTLLSLVLVFLVYLSAFADVDVDGVDDAITSTATCSNLTTASAFTLAGWIKVTNTPTIDPDCPFAGTIVRDGGRLNSLGRLNGSNYCTALWDGSVFKQVTSASSAGWHHLAMTLTGGTLTLYVDGVSAGSTASGNQTCTSDTIFMGTGLADRLAGVLTYDVGLSAGEIANLAGSRTYGPVRTQPTADWRLTQCADGASGDAVSFKDRSGNGRDGTGSDGANNTGLTCRGSEYLKYKAGAQ
jgi:hypothetical protein